MEKMTEKEVVEMSGKYNFYAIFGILTAISILMGRRSL